MHDLIYINGERKNENAKNELLTDKLVRVQLILKS